MLLLLCNDALILSRQTVTCLTKVPQVKSNHSAAFMAMPMNGQSEEKLTLGRST